MLNWQVCPMERAFLNEYKDKFVVLAIIITNVILNYFMFWALHKLAVLFAGINND